MTLLPRTVFGQLALVIALVLIGSLLLAALLGRELATRPASEQLLRAMDSFAAVIEADARLRSRADLVRELRGSGLQVRDAAPSSDAAPRRWQVAPLMRDLQQRAPRALGAGRAITMVEDDGRTQMWLKVATTPPLWVTFDLNHRRENIRRFSVALLLGCIGLVWLAAAYLARRLVVPLRRLAQAAPQLVRGEAPPLDLARGPREVQELALALSHSSQDVRLAAEERTLMLAGISHDVRTPLTRLQYALALVPDTDADLRAGMERDIAEIDAILSQFIAYARDGRDEGSAPLDLVEICRSAIAASHAAWSVSLPDSAPMRGKPMALLRAVENLVVNAQRHGAAPFAIALSRAQDAWCIAVSDGGAGLSEALSARARQPFVHGGAGAGSGLGLAIVERVAQQHGGSLVLETNMPRGLRALLTVRGA